MSSDSTILRQGLSPMPFANGIAKHPEVCHRSGSLAEPLCTWYLPVKAVIDWIAALALLIVLGPVILLAALLVRCTSHGPAFYVQTRLGRHGRRFAIIKLRTMVHNAEAKTGPVWARQTDPRVTPLGQFLRNTHIDEFPQLINVLLGQMSLIGPRPERPEFTTKLEWELPNYTDRLKVRPGITGLAQVKLPPDTTIEDVRRKLAHDLYYVRHVNPWLDLRILGYTGAQLLASLCVFCWRCVALPSRDVVEQATLDLEDESSSVIASSH